MICKKCGREVADDAKVCPYCQADLTGEAVSAAPSGEAAQEKEPFFTKKMKTQSLALLAVCVIAVVCCVVFHLK
ncbi:MAG: zinc ribbon domain-containing protein [Anaerovoracaceae bacterium]|nr:zinc ribbon domain-containing protein [Bacillota bacterium]MDY2670838.1 zinc ribbon domain-containing protein [Anaerovoracaceae bacterium]